ncbi:uncharacterized protein SPSK_02362 [Sporothrix schenckii 1099-18]|uniref:Signal peptide-containing protein n=2 Tax=Sporothrix schenckii TaxID=29908 RepID=U7PLY0_SPOS1|nr:uncharacterized protein SPSK_02362 [Sporothrix schenckii 1099-18]ERS95510.1 hypothetical protein HMPREF1624_08026 [Sporothrix schenckii ATCC 58251]KJR86794.1 hypothetical protein SPSK_02362 [Sporothrix schenckii 1099-18]
MALPVAIQSVVFYYLACTPCMSARTRHRAKKKFDKERKERAAMEEDEPPIYRHPSPFNVNPYWQEEIMMGPSLPKKGRAAKQNSSQRKLTSAGKDSSIATRSSLAISNHGGVPNSSGGSGGILQGANGGSEPLPEGAAAAASDGTDATAAGGAADRRSADNSMPASNNSSGANVANKSRTSGGQPPVSPTLNSDDARSMSMLEATATAATVGTTTTTSAEGWNYKRYQREDEELWGSEPSRTHKLMDAIVKAGSSAGRLLESTLGTKERGGFSTGAYYSGGNLAVTDEDRANFYSPTIIHPPVNDYHPPVVGSKPAHRDALRWMLQPPPPAKVMEGKVPVSRSTSVASSMNGGSMRRSTTAVAGSEVSLTRRMAREARLRRGDSANSGATVTGRPRASSSTSTEEDDAAAVAAAAATANLSRTVSRKSATTGNEIRPKSQQRLGSRGAAAAAAGRSRSGSLASSVEDPNWSSDDDGMLRTKWRFPNAAPPPVPAMPSLPVTAVLPGSSGDAGASFPTSSLQPRSSLHVNSQNPSRTKLETILSSDASGKMDMSRSSSSSRGRKENTRPGVIKGAATSSSTSTSTVVAASPGNGDATKAPHDRSAGSSLDSGLALSS